MSSRLDGSMWKNYHFPEALANVRCPTCGNKCKGYTARIRPGVPIVKYMVPCTHVMTEQQEQAIVNDISKKGI